MSGKCEWVGSIKLICLFVVLFSSVVPHVTDEIQEWVVRVAQLPVARKPVTEAVPDICIIEVSAVQTSSCDHLIGEYIACVLFYGLKASRSGDFKIHEFFNTMLMEDR